MEKIDELFLGMCKKIAKRDPSFLVDILVYPENPTQREVLIQLIQEYGGSIFKSNADIVKCQMPVGKMSTLAESNLVSLIRPSVVHHMH